MAVSILADAIVAEEIDLATILSAPEFEIVRSRDDLLASLVRTSFGLRDPSRTQKPPPVKVPKKSTSSMTFPAAFDRRLKYAFVESRTSRENVFKVFEDFSQFVQEGEREVAFTTTSWGVRTKDGERFVSFQQFDDRRHAESNVIVLREYCRQRSRRWGAVQDGSLVLSDGTTFSIDQLTVIETNPPGNRLSDRGGYDPQRRLKTAIEWMRRAHKSDSEDPYQSVVHELEDALVAEEINVASILADATFKALRERNDFKAMIARYS
jgi:hypothetical protein